MIIMGKDVSCVWFPKDIHDNVDRLIPAKVIKIKDQYT